MKKLIAQRPIQYMGRTYAPGDALPAYDRRMVEAWLNAKTAAWTGDEPDAVVQAAKAAAHAEHMAAGVLRNMGVTIQDENGKFVGEGTLAEQIMALGRESAQEGADHQGDQEPAGGGNAAQGGQEGTETGENAAGASDTLTGHLDAKQLERMTKADLQDLAAKLGVDLSGAKNNAERAALIAAVEVQAPKDENGGAQ